MRLVMVAAGFTAEEADQLRKAMAAWKRHGALDKFYSKVVQGMLANGYSQEFAERCFQQIKGFGEYGFPESHAASFALLVYASAWLKRHHPAAFACALLNSQPMGFYAPAQLVRDASQHGVPVRPVDVNQSQWDCTLENQGVAKDRSKSESNAAGTVAPALRSWVPDDQGYARSTRAADRRVPNRLGRFTTVEQFHRDTALPAGRGPASGGRRRLWVAGPHPSPRILEALALEDAPRSAVRPRARSRSCPVTGHSGGRAGDPAGGRGRAAAGNANRAGGDGGLRDDRAFTQAAPGGARPGGTGAPRDHQRGDRKLQARRLGEGGGPRSDPPAAGTASGIVFVTLEDETGIVNLIVRPDVYDRHRPAARGAMLLQADGFLERHGKVVHVLPMALYDLTDLLAGYRFRSRDFK